MDPCFPEPAVEDPTYGQDGEHRAAFLRRSTWERARELRDFYNRNLALLPAAAAGSLCRGLHGDPTLARHFELVVGRFLQLLGARQIEYEVPSSDGHRVDWLATFEDGAVSVEATLPVANAIVDDTQARASPDVAMIVREAPPGWHVMVGSVPKFHPNQSRQPLRRVLREAFLEAPRVESDAHWSFARSFDEGRLSVHLWAGTETDPQAPARWGSGPGVGFMDDTSIVVHDAVVRKRRQVRHAVRPVLLAVCTNGFGSHEIDNFDVALLGRTIWNVDTGVTRFEPNGALSPNPPEKEPAIAGVIAFVNLQMRGGPEPTLYMHPRFTGTLPSAFSRLRRRYATDDAVAETPAEITNLLDELGWPTS